MPPKSVTWFTRGLFRLLVLIDRAGNTGMPMTELAEKMEVSRSTIARMISHARDCYDCTIHWNGDRYTIRDWGVFDPKRVRQTVRRDRARAE